MKVSPLESEVDAIKHAILNDCSRTGVLTEVARERQNQDAKWGHNQNHTNEMWIMILEEEIKELKKILLFAAKNKDEICENAVSTQYRYQAIILAAVVVAMIECSYRNTK